jgi:pilus assembly protein Flp/PilA
MKNLVAKLLRLLSDEDGPTAVEYAVMLSLIVCVCVAAITSIGQSTSSVFSKLSNSI